MSVVTICPVLRSFTGCACCPSSLVLTAAPSHALTVTQVINRREHALTAGVPGQERLGVTFVTSVVEHVLSDKEKGGPAGGPARGA